MTPSEAMNVDPGAEPEPRAESVRASYVSRLVLFDRRIDADLYWGRSSIRRSMLSMAPDDGGAGLREDRRTSAGDVFWGLQAPNGLTVAIGVGDYPDHVSARRHAIAILGHADLLELCSVSDARTGRSSVWAMLHGRVVIVSGRAWTRAKTSALGSFRRVLRPSTMLHGAGLHHPPVQHRAEEPEASPAGGSGLDPDRYLWT